MGQEGGTHTIAIADADSTAAQPTYTASGAITNASTTAITNASTAAASSPHADLCAPARAFGLPTCGEGQVRHAARLRLVLPWWGVLLRRKPMWG